MTWKSTSPGGGQLKVSLSDVVDAFESSFPEMSHYLDLESGEVIVVTGEMRGDYEQMVSDAEAEGQDFATALAARDLKAWEKEELALVDRAEEGFGDTVILIPNDESSDAFEDMEASPRPCRTRDSGSGCRPRSPADAPSAASRTRWRPTPPSANAGSRSRMRGSGSG